jgi:hypothetical protein
MTNPQDPLACLAVRIAFPNGAVRILPVHLLCERLPLDVEAGRVDPALANEILASDVKDPTDTARVRALLSAVSRLPWEAVWLASFRTVPDPKPRHDRWWMGEPYCVPYATVTMTLRVLGDRLEPLSLRWTLGDDPWGTRPNAKDPRSHGNALEIMAWLQERPDVTRALRDVPPTADVWFGQDTPLRLSLYTDYETGDQTLCAKVGIPRSWGSDLDGEVYYNRIEEYQESIRARFPLDSLDWEYECLPEIAR